jgi:hypothetical protein
MVKKVRPNKLKKDFSMLKILTKLKAREFKSMVDNLPDDTIDNVCECVFNLIYNPTLLSKGKQNKLRSFIKSKCSIHRLKNIADKNQPVFKRREILKQEGKGLPFLLGSLIPLIGSLFS